jgi:hypothetical protein
MTQSAEAVVFHEGALATVLLLHECPDGTRHVDWMLACDDSAHRPLITFRAAGRIDELAEGASLPLERLGDHRPLYLEYEGEISGGRGTVRRLARGQFLALQPGNGSGGQTLEVRWGGAAGGCQQILVLVPQIPPHWRVTCVTMGR